MMPQDAYVQAAKIFREQENTNIQSQKQDIRMQQAHTASQILQKGGGLADILAAGISDPGILGALPQPQWVSNPHEPGGGSFKNPGLRGPAGPSGQGNMQPSQGTQNSMINPQQAPEQNMNMGNRMPAPTVPFSNNTPAEQQANIDVQKRRVEETDKWMKDLSDQANAASNVITNIGRVKKAIPKMFTGTGANTKYQASKAIGVFGEATEATEKFESAVSQVIENLQNQQKRGVTDSGRDLIIATKPHLEHTEKGSMSISNAIDAHAKGQLQKAKAAQEWLKAGGTKDEFDLKWREFEEANPFITENPKNGLLEVHEENIHKWKDAIFGHKANESKENPFLKEMQRRSMMQ
jgi:hypothetical protein